MFRSNTNPMKTNIDRPFRHCSRWQPIPLLRLFHTNARHWHYDVIVMSSMVENWYDVVNMDVEYRHPATRYSRRCTVLEIHMYNRYLELYQDLTWSMLSWLYDNLWSPRWFLCDRYLAKRERDQFVLNIFHIFPVQQICCVLLNLLYNMRWQLGLILTWAFTLIWSMAYFRGLIQALLPHPNVR